MKSGEDGRGAESSAGLEAFLRRCTAGAENSFKNRISEEVTMGGWPIVNSYDSMQTGYKVIRHKDRARLHQ